MCLAPLRAKPCALHTALLLSSGTTKQSRPIALAISLVDIERDSLGPPAESSRLVGEQPPLAFECPSTAGQERRKTYHEPNQLSIIGFVGNNAETKYLPNGTPVMKFSVATKKSWKGENGEWKDKTQWHNVVGLGKGFEAVAARLIKGAHVFVQGELSTREYDRTITVPVGKGKSIEHVIQQLVVELRAETIRILDRSIGGSEQNNATKPANDEDIPA
jgi:single-strand DNA-binding protein